ncbi:AroM family protein [Virgibacillus halophilus]|uniref:AroM family protein n=1 Tax=Tigheibacillus halophilus TaxID=361280 RepID=A0ABU5C3V9_9BACI|nr:AroM family protein [Virgibacillus halophilus]
MAASFCQKTLLITIGQTPRNDLMDAFESANLNNIQMLGALDALSEEKLEALKQASSGKAEKLFVVLKNGTANIAHQFIEEQIRKLVEQHYDQASLIVILCMSDFEAVELPKVVSPIQLMMEKAKQIKSGETVLICVPIQEQLETAKKKWKNVNGDKYFAVVNPKEEQVSEQMMQQLAVYQPKHLIMDCYGYDYEIGKEIEKRYPCTVYNGQSLIIDKICNNDVLY